MGLKILGAFSAPETSYYLIFIFNSVFMLNVVQTFFFGQNGQFFFEMGQSALDFCDWKFRNLQIIY